MVLSLELVGTLSLWVLFISFSIWFHLPVYFHFVTVTPCHRNSRETNIYIIISGHVIVVHILILLTGNPPALQVPPFLGANSEQRWTKPFLQLLNTLIQRNQPTAPVDHKHKILNRYVLEQCQSTKLSSSPIF